MYILTSNDDGHFAQGNTSLRRTLKSYGHKMITVAPDRERSSTGHGISLTKPLRLNKKDYDEAVDGQVYACSGLPADCLLLGLGVLVDKKDIDLVVTGINHGANLGQDLYYSGTVAAAREACFRGLKAIATSLVFMGDKTNQEKHFDVLSHFVQSLIECGIINYLDTHFVLNINAPNLPLKEIQGALLGEVGKQLYSEEVIHRLDGRGSNYYWVGGVHVGHEKREHTDCVHIDNHFITATLLHHDPLRPLDESVKVNIAQILKEAFEMTKRRI